MDEMRKFRIQVIEGSSYDGVKIQSIVKRLNKLRSAMQRCRAIGVNPEIDPPEGLPYGNLSARLEGKRFLCTATKTSGLLEVDKEHYTIVEDYDEKSNTLFYSQGAGKLAPSVEAATHDGIYRGNPLIQCIAHGHLQDVYEYYRSRLEDAVVIEDAAYGTPELRKRAMEESAHMLRHTIPEGLGYYEKKGNYGLLIPKRHFHAFFIAGESIEDVLEGFLISARDARIGMIHLINQEFS